MMKWLENNHARRATRVFLALILSIIVNSFFSTSGSVWLPVTAMIVMVTRTGSAFFQGILRFFAVIFLIVLGSWVSGTLTHLDHRLQEATVGALIGIFCNTVILRDRVDVEFRRVMVPVMKAYADYFSSIVALLLRREFKAADHAKIAVENALLKLPSWVFERGFDLALRKGHRYFFLKTVHISEILLAMHHLARYEFDRPMLTKLRKPLIKCVKKIDKLLTAFSNVLQLKKLHSGVEDFSFEIKKMDTYFRKNVAKASSELATIEKGPVYLAEFIFDLNELHDTLLSLAATLR